MSLNDDKGEYYGEKEPYSGTAEADPTDVALPAFLQKLRYTEKWIDHKLGIETQGVNRIPEEERRPPPLINIFLIWFSFDIQAPTLPIGLVGAQLGLSLHLNVTACVVGTLLGCAFPAFTGTLGPKLGCRQIASSRFSYGIWGARLCAVLQCITAGGFLVVDLITAGSLLSAAADYRLSIVVGIILVAVVAYIISLFGYRVLQVFEKYSWIVAFVLLWVLIGQAAPQVDPSTPSTGSSLTIAGNFLSVLAVNMSNGIGWSTAAADYYVNYPPQISRWKVACLTYSGLVISTVFPVMAGVLVGNVALSTPANAENFQIHGFGGAVRDIYHPLGWSKTCLVLLTFSALGNVVGICYSCGLCLQLLCEYFRAIPRYLWSLLFIIVVTVIAVAGREHLEAIVNDIVSIIGYWTISFAVVLFIEDRVFRRKSGYIPENWNTQNKLPLGAAAVFSTITGYAAGGVPGMAQSWYVGPIARKFGPEGGDVGLWMTGVITAVVYLATRSVEKHYVGR